MEEYDRSVTFLRETCAKLFDDVQTSTDLKKKMSILSQIREVVLHQLQVVDRVSEECLGDIVSYICQLVTDRHQDVRKWMVSILCEIVKEKESSLIPQTIEVVYHVIQSCQDGTDTMNIQANLLKSCLQGFTDVFPLTFQRTCFFPQEFQVTWQYAMKMKEIICDQFLNGENEGLRTHAIKFLQTLIIVYSNSPFNSSIDQDGDNVSGVDINAQLIPEDHHYLSRRYIIQEANDRLGDMLGQVHSKSMSSGNILAILNAMGSILKSRPQYLAMVVTSLLPLQKHPPLHLTPLQIKSLHHTLKLLLQSILKLPGVEPFKASIQEVWTILSGKMTTKTSRSLTDRRAFATTAHKRLSLSEEPNLSEPIDIESKRQRMHVDPELQNTLFNPHQFPYPFLLDLVMISMLNLPERMPGYVIQQMADLASRRGLTGGDQRKDTRKMDSRAQTRAQMTANIDGTSQVSTIRTPTGLLPLQSLAADIASFGQSDEKNQASLTPMEVMNRIITVSRGLKDIQGLLMNRILNRDERLQRSQLDRGGLGVPIKSEFLEETRRSRLKPFVLEVNEEYSFDKLTTILKGVFERLISPEAEQLASDTGSRKTWITLICKLITTDISGSIEMDHLKDLMRERLDTFILENFKDRYELAITWMYHEYAADEDRKLSMIKEEKKSFKKLKYPIYFTRLLHGLKRSIEPNDKIFTRFVLDVPDLRETDLEALREFCEDSERMALGLATLRDLVTQRTHSRDLTLRILLDLCVQKNKTLRTAAILVVKKWIPGNASYSYEVENFATRHLEDLTKFTISSPAVADSQESLETALEEEISRHLELFLALTSKKPELFNRIVHVYVKSPETVQKVIRLQSYGLIRLFGSGSQELLDVLRNPPKGAETFALRILLVLTDKATEKPSVEIVTIVKDVFEERHLDARFLIPVLSSFDRSDVLRYLPSLMKLPKTAFEQVVQKLIVSEHGPAPMDPTDLLFTLHVIDPLGELVSLPKIKDATQVCLDKKEIFKQEVLSAVIQRLVDHTPLPLLLMRTLIQTATLYPGLVNFLNHTVARLIAKKIWTSPQLWEGFIKYCQLIKYHAASVVLQLPRSQALEVLTKAPSLKADLEHFFATHATHQLCNKFYALSSKSFVRERSVNQADHVKISK